MRLSTATYRDRFQAERALSALLDGGRKLSQISLVMSQKTQQREFGNTRYVGDELLAGLVVSTVLEPALGMFVSSRLLDELGAVSRRRPLRDVLVKQLGIGLGEADALVRSIQSGGIAFIIKTDEPAVASHDHRSENYRELLSPGDLPIYPILPERVLPSNIQLLNPAFADVDDPTMRRFAQLEIEPEAEERAA